MADTRLGISIEAQNRANQALGQAINDVKRLDAAVKQAKQTADGSAASNQRVGQAVTQLAAAKARLKTQTAEATRLTEGFARAQTQLTSALSSSAQALSARGGALGGFLAGAGGTGLVLGAFAGIGAAMTGLARNVADVAEESENLQAQLGLTASGVGALKTIAGDTGVSFESLSVAVHRLNVRIGEARNGNEDAAQAFKDLGVSLRDSNGNIRTTAQLAPEVARALLGIEDAGERARLSQETLGRSGNRVLRALASDFEAAEKKALELGITIEGNVKASAERADTAFDRLGRALSGFQNSVGALAAMTITPLIEQFADLAEAIAKAAKRFAESPWGRVVTGGLAFGPAGFLIPPNQGQVNEVIANARARASGADGGASGTGGDTKDVLAEQIKLIEARVALQPRLVEGAIKELEAKRDQVATARELLQVEQAISRLRGIPVPGPIGPTLPSLPSFPVTVQGTPGSHTGLVDASGKPIKLGDFTQQDMERTDQTITDARRSLEIYVETLKEQEDASKAAGATLSALGDSLFSALSLGLSRAIREAENLGDVLTAVLNSAIDQLLSVGVGAGLKAIFPFLQQGGMPVSRFQPIHAQTGMVVNGIRGIDGVGAIVGRDEAVISHTKTDSWDRILHKLDALISSRPRTDQAAPSGPMVPITFERGAIGGALFDEKRLTDIVTDRLAANIEDAVRRGRLRLA